MNNIKLSEALKQIGNGLVTLGEALQHAEGEVGLGAATVDTAQNVAEKKTRVKKADATAANMAATPSPLPATGEASVPVEKVRDALLAFAGNPAFGPEKAKALLAQFKATRVSDLEVSFYPQFIKAIEAASAASSDFAS